MLIKCPECERDVSTTAPSCPGCGHVFPKPSPFAGLSSYHDPGVKKPGALLPVLGIGGVVVAGMIAIGSLSPSAPVSSSPPPAARDMSIPGAISPDLVADYVKPHLKDPDSAKFSDVTYRTRHSLPVFCGTVNSRNGFGGYVGDEQFIALGNLVSLSEETSTSKWRKLWNGYCVDTDATDAAKHKKPKPA